MCINSEMEIIKKINEIKFFNFIVFFANMLIKYKKINSGTIIAPIPNICTNISEV